MQFNSEIISKLATVLHETGSFVSKTELDKAVAALIRRHSGATGNSDWSISTVIRGMVAREGRPINPATAEADVNYVAKALSTGATTGSYLVPTIQANDIIGYLSTNGILRQVGPRIWPMAGIQKMTVPTAAGLPTVQYLGQNSTDTATDPSLGQVSFDLKTRRSLTAVPAELLRASTPALDSLLTELIGTAFAEHEDDAFFGTSSKSGGPTALMAAANISTVNTAGSANGGNLAYSDLLAVLAKAAAVKAKGPFVWVMSPRTYWQRLAGLIDTTSRPIFLPGQAGLAAEVPQRLFGYPVFVTPFIAENEALGSGSNQSHLIFTNPKYCHIAEASTFEIAVSTERYFELNQIGIRGISQHDFGFGPAAGIVVLRGIN